MRDGVLSVVKSRSKRFLKNACTSEVSFESGEECDLVALTGRSGDSIYAAVVYPYKSNIPQSSEEYPRWFYEGRKYLIHIKDKTIYVYDSK